MSQVHSLDFPKTDSKPAFIEKSSMVSYLIVVYMVVLGSAALALTSLRRKHVNLLHALGHPSINVTDEEEPGSSHRIPKSAFILLQPALLGKISK